MEIQKTDKYNETFRSRDKHEKKGEHCSLMTGTQNC